VPSLGCIGVQLIAAPSAWANASLKVDPMSVIAPSPMFATAVPLFEPCAKSAAVRSAKHGKAPVVNDQLTGIITLPAMSAAPLSVAV